MNDLWREWLYPLGFLSSVAFCARMLVQWLSSEKKRESTVTPLFWQLSLCGNLTLMLHAFIQIQFHVALIQAGNAVISWRNLNLMLPKEKHFSLKQTMQILTGAIFLCILGFAVQGMTLSGNAAFWFRIPATPWQSHSISHISFWWHMFGCFGLALFSTRFWIQWWYAEKFCCSYFNPAFWWTSLMGEGICLIYFLYIGDPVNYIGPLFGLVPTIRNLMLIYAPHKTSKNNGIVNELE